MDQQTSLKMIEELSNAYGASGFEDDVLLVGRKYGEGLARIEENCIRDLFFYRNENTGDKPVILLDGHSDEVGFMVQAIKPNGTLQFTPSGRMGGKQCSRPQSQGSQRRRGIYFRCGGQ